MDTDVLDPNSYDKKVSVWKNILGEILGKMLPVGGSFITEVVFSFIPNQRQDRIADFLKELSEQFDLYQTKVDSLETWIESVKSNKQQIHLLEMGLQTSAETNSNFLHHCYAYYIFHNIENKIMDDIQREKLLKTISELNEYEIIHLISYTKTPFDDFTKKYANILQEKSREIGTKPENIISNAFRDGYLATLEQKGLLQVDGITYGLEKTKFKISSYGKLVVDAIYDEDFLTVNRK